MGSNADALGGGLQADEAAIRRPRRYRGGQATVDNARSSMIHIHRSPINGAPEIWPSSKANH